MSAGRRWSARTCGGCGYAGHNVQNCPIETARRKARIARELRSPLTEPRRLALVTAPPAPRRALGEPYRCGACGLEEHNARTCRGLERELDRGGRHGEGQH